MFADALTRDSVASNAQSEHKSTNTTTEGLQRGNAGGLPQLPHNFVAQEAMAITAEHLLLQSSQRPQRLSWDLEDKSGKFLGRLDQHGVDDPRSMIKFHNARGETIAKATREWILGKQNAKPNAPLHKQGVGQIITLSNARTQATVAKVVEFAPWDYRSPITGWLNSFYTSFVVFNDRNEEEALIRRYSVPRLFCRYRGIDTNGLLVANFRLPFAFVRWKTRWSFSTTPPEEGGTAEQAKSKSGRLNSLIFPIMAAFHSIDTQQSSIFKRIFG